MNDQAIVISSTLINKLNQYDIIPEKGLLPTQVFSWGQLLTARGLIMMVGGGFLVGFDTRYAGGCTSGHSIMGLSNLQWPSFFNCYFMLYGRWHSNGQFHSPLHFKSITMSTPSIH